MHYMIRIELLEATWQNYTDMATDLAARGITDVIVGGNGVRYKLPPAEYTCNDGTWTMDTVFTTAKWAAAKTGRKNRVVVAEASQIKWEGLDAIEARRTA